MFYRTTFCRLNSTLAIDRLPQRINYATNKGIPYWYVHDFAGTAYFIAFFNQEVVTK